MVGLGVGGTDVGQRRGHNEDAFHIDNDFGWYLVCDGMGGHAHGERASRMAVDTAIAQFAANQELLQQAWNGHASIDAVSELAEGVVHAACRAIFDLAASDGEFAGMGTTMTLLVLVGTRGILAHVGDSRLYLRRGSDVHQLSNDHTMVAEFIRSGMAPENAKNSRFAHVLTRAVGNHPDVSVDTLVFDLMPRDQMVLCSDGLHDYLEAKEDLLNHLVRDPEEVPDALIAFANKAGGEDNITCVVVSIEDEEFDAADTLPAANSFTDLKHGVVPNLPLLEGLPLRRYQPFLNICRIQRAGVGDVLVAEGTRSDTMYVVLDGELELVRDGKVVRVLRPGESVGESMLFHDRPASGTLRATEVTDFGAVSREAFRTLVRERPWLGVILLERLGLRLSQALERLNQRNV